MSKNGEILPIGRLSPNWENEAQTESFMNKEISQSGEILHNGRILQIGGIFYKLQWCKGIKTLLYLFDG